MKLVPLPARYLLIHSELPFNVFDAGARLLLAAGQSIDGPVREHLLRRELFVEAARWAAWGAWLEPDAGQAKPPPAGGAQCPSLGQAWAELAVALESALREPGADGAWVQEARAGAVRGFLHRCAGHAGGPTMAARHHAADVRGERGAPARTSRS
ncbi:hypothetical protein [Azohydromonas caseinilytica]|uniref:Uncharacterized protein n=1 Tax=Azohydromonas caseinilytica TaxID=2728836 RepID=A0A848F8P7_9BURK|nr:hypothetical protein [Azohydromonas caseinilytica]NML14889.1 hypothetical protein [Azohydromonas caseinilytica]